MVIITIITFISVFFVSLQRIDARLAQLVEHDLPKVGVAGSSLVSRSGPEVEMILLPAFLLSQKHA